MRPVPEPLLCFYPGVRMSTKRAAAEDKEELTKSAAKKAKPEAEAENAEEEEDLGEEEEEDLGKNLGGRPLLQY